MASYSISPGSKKAVYMSEAHTAKKTGPCHLIMEVKLCTSWVMLWQCVFWFHDGPNLHPYMSEDPSAEPVHVFMRVGSVTAMGHQSPALYGEIVKAHCLRSNQRLLISWNLQEWARFCILCGIHTVWLVYITFMMCDIPSMTIIRQVAETCMLLWEHNDFTAETDHITTGMLMHMAFMSKSLPHIAGSCTASMNSCNMEVEWIWGWPVLSLWNSLDHFLVSAVQNGSELQNQKLQPLTLPFNSLHNASFVCFNFFHSEWLWAVQCLASHEHTVAISQVRSDDIISGVCSLGWLRQMNDNVAKLADSICMAPRSVQTGWHLAYKYVILRKQSQQMILIWRTVLVPT